jgi:hypothetical protein
MTATYWEIGRRIVEFEQGGAERAAYGDALVERLAKDLTQRFGRNELARQFYETEALRGGWSVRQLERQINSQFYERTALSRKRAELESHPELPEVLRMHRVRIER